MSDSRKQDFSDAKLWSLPRISGQVINPPSETAQSKDIHQVKSFEDNVRKQLEALKAEAEIPVLTVDTIEAIQKQAYDEAFEAGRREGHDKGYETGYASGKEKIQQQSNQLGKLLNALTKPMDEVDQQVEQQLTELVYIISRTILQHELKTDATHIQNLIQKTIALLPLNNREIKVKLNPADIELMKQGGVDLAEQDWKTVSDQTIAAGGCIVETDNARIDASLEARMQQLTAELFEDLTSPSVSEDAETAPGDRHE